jgi:hypothetical protein
MAVWANDDLDRIGVAEELQIAGRRASGTLRRPVTIWVVRQGDDLYVRSVRGASSGWYRGTRSQHEGHIRAGGLDRDVAFVDVADAKANAQIDEAYRSKYHRYGPSYTDPMVTPGARATTMKLVPR